MLATWLGVAVIGCNARVQPVTPITPESKGDRIGKDVDFGLLFQTPEGLKVYRWTEGASYRYIYVKTDGTTGVQHSSTEVRWENPKQEIASPVPKKP